MAEFLRRLETFDKDWLMAVLSSVGDGVISLDDQDQINFANLKACEILDLSFESVIGVLIDDVIQIKNDHIEKEKMLKEWIISEGLGIGGVPKNSYIVTHKNNKKYISVQFSKIMHADTINFGSVLIIRDISSIVEAEQKALIERDNMVNMFSELPIGMVIIDHSLRIINANQSFIKMMHLDRQKVIGTVLGDGINCVWSFENGCGHSMQCLYCKLRGQLQSYIDKGIPFKNFLTEIIYESLGVQSKSWMNLCFLPSEIDGTIQYLVTIEDHTDRINHERILSEARNTSMTILNNLPVMIFRLNQHMECDFINETFKSFFNITSHNQFNSMKEKFFHNHYEIFYTEIHKNFVDKKAFSIELKVKNVLHQTRHILLLGNPMIESHHSMVGMLGVIFDIHDEKVAELLYRQSQKKYFSLFQNMDSSVIYLNVIPDRYGIPIDAAIIECNQSTENLIKIRSSKIINKRISEIDFLTEFEIKQLLNRFDHVLKTGESYHLNELYLVNLDRWIELSIYSPEHNYVAILMTDIDSIKRTEIALMKEKERSEEANRVKSEFLANMSHEIRTPLNGIVGMIDLTLMEPLNAEQNENLSTAKECVTSLIDIINDILDFSKIEAGKLKIEPIAFKLTDLIENTLKMHIPHIKEKNLDLEVDLSGVIQNEVMSDSKRIKQVLNNLINNAIKFTEHGHIRIKVVQDDMENGALFNTKFQIVDSGIGIDYTKQNLLFNSFTQIDGSYTRKYGGTGLGLVISKQLVEMMSGKISFQSEPNVGSTFEFVLPLETAHLVTEGEAVSDFSPSVYQGKHILLVEDDKVNQVVMSKMIEREGIKVTIADNGYIALKECNSVEFDMILMDIQMPIMDGIESTRQIRMNSQFNRLTPIVALTAFALRGDEEIFKASGMDSYISKPVDRNNLITLLNDTLKNKKFNSESLMNQNPNEYDLALRMDRETSHSKILNNETLYELKHRIKQLNTAYLQEDYLVLEVNAHQLKVRFEALKIEELKNLAFKIELELRKERFEKVGELILQLQKIIDGFNKSEEDLDE